MKKILLSLLCLSALTFSQTKTLKIGATPVPYAQLLNDFAKPELKKQGIDLVVVEFTDYIQPNLALQNGDIDVNFFQHQPYLETFTADRKIKGLIAIKPICLPPLGLYSKKHKSIADLKDKMTIAVPNDPSNEARSLILLESNGIIKLKDNKNLKSTINDIAENPKKIKFVELDAAQLPRSLGDVDFAIVNANYALASGIYPSKDSVLLEKAQGNPYTNVLATRKEKEKDPLVIALVNLLTSPAFKQYMLDKYPGALIPAF